MLSSKATVIIRYSLGFLVTQVRRLFPSGTNVNVNLAAIILLVVLYGPVWAAAVSAAVVMIGLVWLRGVSPISSICASCRYALAILISGFIYEVISSAQSRSGYNGQVAGVIPIVLFAALYALVNYLVNLLSSFPLRAGAIWGFQRLSRDLLNFAVAVPLGVAMTWAYEEKGLFGLAIIGLLYLSTLYVLGLNTRLEMANRQLSVLNEVAQQIGSALQLERVFDLILSSVGRVVEYDVCALFLYDSTREELNPVLIRGPGGKGVSFGVECSPIPIGLGPIGRVAIARKGEVISDASRESIPPFVRQPPVKGMMFAPLVLEGELLGVLVVGSLKPMAFSGDHLRLLTVLSSQASVAIANAIVYKRTEELAITDSMTGLYNYRYLQMRLDDELRKARARNLQLSVIYVDIDNFKDYNDTYGHQAGDVILRRFAESLKRFIRDSDVAARYGGDEFLVILPNTGYSEACNVARRLQEGIASQEFVIDNVPVPVTLTVSVGVASHPEAGITTFDLISWADRAMYKSKRQGLDPIYS